MRINKYTRHTLILMAFGASGHLLTAQMITGNSKRIADGYYNSADYSSAARYYEQSIASKGKESSYVPYQVKRDKDGAVSSKGNPRQESMYRLAESYRKLNDYSHAEPWYKTLLEEAPAAYPLAQLYYGVSLRANGKYGEAETAFKKFLQSYKTKDAFADQATRELNNCLFIQQQLKNPLPDINVTKLDNTINTEGASYAAGWEDAKTLVFTSTRPDGTLKNGKPTYTNALYSASQQGETWGPVTKLNIPADMGFQQGVATFTPDGSKMFFTVWSTDKEGKKTSFIYSSEKKDTSWSQPVKLAEGINADGYSSRQPYITADGKFLIFASDRTGGKGGFDIWYAAINAKGETGRATNAGSVINTKEDEQAPFYHSATQTLVFASNGRTGMGGFDLYFSKGDMKTWSQPENAGYPVNSIKDDMYFVSKGTGLFDNVIISSDRSSLCCLELFSANEVKPVVAAVVEPVKEVAPPVAVNPLQEAFENKTTLVTHAILFAFNAADVSDSSYAYLDNVASYLKENPQVKFEIGAHSDGKGSVPYNLKLSARRAQACIDYLVKAGVEKDRLVGKGYGECCPLVKETTKTGKDIPEARAQNRRVEMKLY